MGLLTEQEIAKRDARIASLTAAGAEYQRQCFEQAARIKELEKKAELPTKYKRMQFNAELQEEVEKQAAEIARLKSELQDLHKRNYITHSLFETGDTDCPEQAKDRNGEVVLGVCKNCGRIEAELAEPCDHGKEIARLKGVIAKCKETLVSSISDLQEPNFVTLAPWRVKEALAAIKEIEHD